MKFEPKFSGYKKKVEDSFNRQGFMRFINAKLVYIKPGFCEIQIPFHKDLTQQHGFFHAGIVGTIADNTAGYAAFSLMEENSSILTVEYKLNLLSPADGEMLIGRGEVVKSGRTLTVCRCDIFVLKDGKEKLCATSQATLFQLEDTADESKDEPDSLLTL